MPQKNEHPGRTVGEARSTGVILCFIADTRESGWELRMAPASWGEQKALQEGLLLPEEAARVLIPFLSIDVHDAPYTNETPHRGYVPYREGERKK